MSAERDAARRERMHEESAGDQPLTAGLDAPFRVDLERIRFAPSLGRLSEVTQVVTAGATGRITHNRLTHSLKVAAIARAVAIAVQRTTAPDVVDALGGCDHVVAQAAAMAHDVGHPPFGHLGERTLDRLGRERFGLSDGFEGNAQTWRILTELEVHGDTGEGLNLTAAVRAGVLKYPWGRHDVPDPHPSTWTDRPRGAGTVEVGAGLAKFNAYVPDLAEMVRVLETFGLEPGRQTLECAVMDVADDVAYSLHDLEDFHRSGVLQHSTVSAELRTWSSERGELASLDRRMLATLGRAPGAGLERLRRHLAHRDGWVFEDELFADAVATVAGEFIDGVLITPFDGSMAAERSIGRFVRQWIEHFIASVCVLPDAPVRAGVVTLTPEAWHSVQVLKFIHRHFVLDRPDLALVQQGQATMLRQLVEAFDSWLGDRRDVVRAPRRLVELVEMAQEGYHRVRAEHPEWLRPDALRGGDEPPDDEALHRMARGRGVLDFVAGLTDTQAGQYAARLNGRGGQLWGAT